MLRNAEGKSIEHFGYIDGRSNPLFLKHELEREDQENWDPSAPLGRVLAPDPFNTAPDAFGSYFVFRKVEENVRGFNLGIRELAARLPVDESLAGALVVGRFKDGTPVTLSPKDGQGDLNDFNFKDDREAAKCPFHAHVRKANQRGETPLTSEESERSRRVVRRGVAYGERAPDLSDEPQSGVGLLFMCYQADIGHQFEFLQRVWFDNPRFPEILNDTGDCPLIGQDGDAPQRWRAEWGDEDAPAGAGQFWRLDTTQGWRVFLRAKRRIPQEYSGRPAVKVTRRWKVTGISTGFSRNQRPRTCDDFSLRRVSVVLRGPSQDIPR